MKLVIALGGNALMKRDEPLGMAAQWKNAGIAARALEPVAREHKLILTHGNGPQVGLLAMQAEAFKDAEVYGFDVMCAATGGMIGYMIEQELGNLLGYDVPIATILTRIEVAADDPEFSNPSKFVGPSFDRAKADELAGLHGWIFKLDGKAWRRVVPSPPPKRILWHRPIRWLLENNAVVICSGGGGIPVVETPDRGMRGIDAVIDKDRASSLLATKIPADLFVLATDVEGVYADYGTPRQRLLREVRADGIESAAFSKGSMGPKVEAALSFVRQTGKPAAIGSLGQIHEIVKGNAGTWFVP